MVFHPDGHQPFRIVQETPLQKAQRALTELIDFTLALAAMCMERNVFTTEELFKMEAILKDARRKLGTTFTIEEGIKAVRAAFHIEGRKDWKSPEGK